LLLFYILFKPKKIKLFKPELFSGEPDQAAPADFLARAFQVIIKKSECRKA
jgi:hypothetical protein